MLSRPPFEIEKRSPVTASPLPNPTLNAEPVIFTVLALILKTGPIAVSFAFWLRRMPTAADVSVLPPVRSSSGAVAESSAVSRKSVCAWVVSVAPFESATNAPAPLRRSGWSVPTVMLPRAVMSGSASRAVLVPRPSSTNIWPSTEWVPPLIAMKGSVGWLSMI